MEKIIKKYKTLLQELDRAKVEPIHIEIDRTVKLIQQQRQIISFQYKTLFRQHIKKRGL